MISTALAALAAVAAHDLLDVGFRGLWGRRRVQSTAQAQRLRRVVAQVAVQAIVVAVVVAACVALAGPAGLLPAAVAAVVLVGWAWTQAWWRPAGALLTAVLAALVLWDVVSGRIGEGTGLSVMVAGAVIVLFLMESGNRVTRSVLSLAGRQDRPPAADTPSGESGAVSAEVSAEELELKGGRFIGPMERILVLGLALAGAEGIIGALLAAKGIVRFPEISADRQRGGRAEEFLVGSLTSWGLAAGGVLLLWLWQNS